MARIRNRSLKVGPGSVDVLEHRIEPDEPGQIFSLVPQWWQRRIGKEGLFLVASTGVRVQRCTQVSTLFRVASIFGTVGARVEIEISTSSSSNPSSLMTSHARSLVSGLL